MLGHEEVLIDQAKTEMLVVRRITNAAGRRRLSAFTEVAATKGYELMREVENLVGASKESICSLEFGEELWNAMHEAVVARLQKRKEDSTLRFTNKSLVRSHYLPTATMVARVALSGKGRGQVRWGFDLDLDAQGLGARIWAHEGKDTSHVLSLQLVNNLPMDVDDDGDETEKRLHIPREEWTFWQEKDFRITKEGVAWKEEAARTLLDPAFPDAVSQQAYSHRLRAPLLPMGFWPSQLVTVTDCKVYDWDGNCYYADHDGAGCYDPDHPAVAEFVALHGPVVMQFSKLRDHTFGKGILRPVPGLSKKLDVDSAFFIDPLQVKGAAKGEFKPMAGTGAIKYVENAYVGAMKTWAKRSTMGAGFEQLENIGPVREDFEPGALGTAAYARARVRVRKLIQELTREGIDNLFRRGVDGLLASIGREDKVIRVIAEFLAHARAVEAEAYEAKHGDLEGFKPSLNPMQIPLVRAAVSDRLQRKLWPIAQGAGIRGDQKVIFRDPTVPEGSVVTAGPLRDCAVWRFPTILATGNLVLRNLAPTGPHQCLPDGSLIANTMWLNPKDVLKMQADDDGDIVAVSFDPRVVELWGYKVDNRLYAIEPDGIKRDIPVDTPEGLEYLSVDQRGPVGVCTIAISKFRAVGDHDAARAAACLNQEAIDSAKRMPRYTDWCRAVDLQNWRNIDGTWYIHWKKLADGTYRPFSYSGSDVAEESKNYLNSEPMDFPLEAFQKWVKARLGLAKHENPIGWYYQYKQVETKSGKTKMRRIKQRINDETWIPSIRNQGGCQAENWVHVAHDTALERWNEVKDEFRGDIRNLELGQLLPRLLEQTGHAVSVPDLTWEEYLPLRQKLGLVDYGKAMQKALRKSDQDQRNSMINQAAGSLSADVASASVQELVTCWVMENTEWWGYKTHRQSSTWTYVRDRNLVPADKQAFRQNKPNNAIRTCAASTSKVLALLGIEVPEQCQFLDAPAKTADTRLKAIVSIGMRQRNPYTWISKFIHADIRHAENVKDEQGFGVSLHECPTCTKKVQDALVRAVRDAAGTEIGRELRELTSALNNQFERTWRREQSIEEDDAEFEDYL